MQLVDLANLSGGLKALVNSFVNEFVALLPTADFGDSNGILNNAAPMSTQLMVPLSSGGVFSMMVKRR